MLRANESEANAIDKELIRTTPIYAQLRRINNLRLIISEYPKFRKFMANYGFVPFLLMIAAPYGANSFEPLFSLEQFFPIVYYSP